MSTRFVFWHTNGWKSSYAKRGLWYVSFNLFYIFKHANVTWNNEAVLFPVLLCKSDLHFYSFGDCHWILHVFLSELNQLYFSYMCRQVLYSVFYLFLPYCRGVKRGLLLTVVQRCLHLHVTNVRDFTACDSNFDSIPESEICIHGYTGYAEGLWRCQGKLSAIEMCFSTDYITMFDSGISPGS